MQKMRVVVVSASLIDQMRLEKSLRGMPDVELVAVTSDLSAAYMAVEELVPDYVFVGLNFFRQEEYQCMDALFRAVETKVIVIKRSASEVNWRTSGQDHFITSQMSPDEIITILEAVPHARKLAVKSFCKTPVSLRIPATIGANPIVLIGASTGGIDALTTILPHFPQDCPPTAIVQHTGQNFSATLVRLMDKHCGAQVVLAQTGLAFQTGRVCLAGGIDGHLRLQSRNGLECDVRRGPATSGHLPSIDELFMSAVPYARDVIAVLLTGMGRDGATGLQTLRQAGAITIGQDEASSVVYGMPRVAHEIGAVQYQLPLAEIGPAIMTMVHQAATRQRGACA